MLTFNTCVWSVYKILTCVSGTLYSSFIQASSRAHGPHPPFFWSSDSCILRFFKRENVPLCRKKNQNKTKPRVGEDKYKKKPNDKKRKTKINKVMQNRKIWFMLRHKCFWRICWKYQKHYQYIRYMKYHTWLNPGSSPEKWIYSPEPLRVLQL